MSTSEHVGEQLHDAPARQVPARHIALDGAGQHIAVGFDDGRIAVWRTGTAAPIAMLTATGIRDLLWLADRTLAAQLGDGWALFDLSTWSGVGDRARITNMRACRGGGMVALVRPDPEAVWAPAAACP